MTNAVLRELYFCEPNRLENVGQEVVSPVISLGCWIVIVPLAVVNWDLHFRRISMVEAVAAAIVLIAIKVLWIVHIWVVIESFVVAIARSTTPCLAICLRLRLSLLGLGVVVRGHTSDNC